jgi:serine/threonine-protein kinase
MQILFEKFEIIEVLKKDSHSTVYLANHIFLGKKIILKTLDTQKLTDPAILNRFKREAKILAKLDHPNIIKVLDFGIYQNNFYLSFEYFYSENLRELLKSGKISDSDKKLLFIQLLKALNAAHSSHIIHRDIKPENILINDLLELKIADFGLAIEKDENLMTSKSSIVGTPAYMSPEQIKGVKLTPQSDLFSLGIVVYELFSGINPFLGKDINETINNILSFDEEKIFEQFLIIDKDITVCIKKMFKKDIEKRPESISILFEELGISGNEDIQHDTKIRIEKKLIIYPLAAIAAIIIFVIIVFVNENESSIEPINNRKDFTVINESDTNENNQENNILEKELPLNNNVVNKEKKEEDLIKINKDKEIKKIESVEPAKLYIQILPWADVVVDSNKIQNSNGYVSLKPGMHKIELLNPGYPIYSTDINLEPSEIKYFKIHLDTLFGYLQCKVFPWGEVFIDGKHVGQTPFFKPFILNPGNHYLSVHNPEYEIVNKSLFIVKNETLHFEINLEQRK